MRYYLVKVDKKYIHIPQILNWFHYLNTNKMCEKRILLRIKPNKDTYFTDIISYPIFMISEKQKECIALYEPNLSFKQIILLDQKYKQTKTYYMPQLREISCLTEHAVFNLDHSELSYIEIDSSKVKDTAIFRLKEVSNTYVLVRLDLLESMLRRDPIGIQIEEVDVVKGGSDSIG